VIPVLAPLPGSGGPPPGWRGILVREDSRRGQRGSPAARAGDGGPGYAVTACLVSLLVTWMLRGLAFSWTGMVSVSTPAA
jgi:hypothetical protein